MSDRELLNQIWLKLLEMESRLIAIENKTTCIHDFGPDGWYWLNESKAYKQAYRCRKCGAGLS